MDKVLSLALVMLSRTFHQSSGHRSKNKWDNIKENISVYQRQQSANETAPHRLRKVFANYMTDK